MVADHDRLYSECAANRLSAIPAQTRHQRILAKEASKAIEFAEKEKDLDDVKQLVEALRGKYRRRQS